MMKINNVGDLVEFLNTHYSKNTKIECVYYDIMGNSHIRPLTTNVFNGNMDKITLNVTY